MKIIFFGTPGYVVPILDTIHKQFKSRDNQSPFVAVVTQKPKPAGRKKRLTHSPVDQWAHSKKIELFYDPRKILENPLTPDLGILASYGEILPKRVIDHFPKGIINVHPSLLPKYRGGSPVPSAITAGEVETGISLMKLDYLVDHGPIISQVGFPIKKTDTTESLLNDLFNKGADILEEALPAYYKGKIKPKEQEHGDASFTKIIRKNDAFIDPQLFKATLKGKSHISKWRIPFIKGLTLTSTPENIDRFIRAMYSWPIAWTFVRTNPKTKDPRRLKIIKTSIRGGKLVPKEVQIEGKNKVTWKQFTQGYPKAMFV